MISSANSHAQAVDIEADDLGAHLSLLSRTPEGDAWLIETLDYERWQVFGDALLIDHRYGPDVLSLALEAGLYVTLDGREPL